MFSNCFQYFLSDSISQSELNQPSRSYLETNHLIEPPLLLKALNFVGLKDLLVDKFIFARKQPGISWFNTAYKVQIVNKKCKFHFRKAEFKEIAGYSQSYHLIDLENHFIPIVHFKREQTISSLEELVENDFRNLRTPRRNFSQDRLTIVYSHGNSSDIQDSYNFISLVTQIYRCDFIIYDYTGYTNGVGEPTKFSSSQHKLNQKSVSEDLKRVLQWSQIPLQNIVLWGFSLGCHPTLKVASEMTQINGVILQSPFASIYRLVSGEVSYQKTFKNDIFCNIELIQKVQSNILIMHSHDDEIIPHWHAESLFKRCQSFGKCKFIKLLELKKFGHNNLDQAFYAKKTNKLQEYLKIFIRRCGTDSGISVYTEKKFFRTQDTNQSSKRPEKSRKIHRLGPKSQVSIALDPNLSLTERKKHGRKLSLSSVFLAESRKHMVQSMKITPMKGDSQETIESSSDF